MQENKIGTKPSSWSSALWLFLLVLGILAGFFWRSVEPSQVIFSNDGPVGAACKNELSMPAGYFGIWSDLNWLGFNGGSIPVSVYWLLVWVLGPIGSAKFMFPLTLLFLALSSWLFFRRAGLGATAATFGAVAAMLNSSIFSDGAWGLMTHTITAGLNFLALAALSGKRGPYWVRLVLAGFAVGMGVIESADIGALYSLVVAAWVVYQGWAETDGSMVRRLALGGARLAVVAVCAGLIASQTIITMVSTQIVGIVGTEQNQQSKAEKWDWATQWSLPKKEAVSLIVPGLFGYRGRYWGQIGRAPGWEQHHQGFPRYSGTGCYAGILVVILAIWAMVQATQRGASVFSLVERRWIWFWAAVFLVSLLFAFGRHAPFYQLLYALPYFSTIRNPVKFLFFVGWALPVLAAFGVQGLIRAYVTPGSSPGSAAKHRAFNRKWFVGSLALGGAAIIGWLIYSGSRPDLVRFLQTQAFGPQDAEVIAKFSIAQAGWALLFLLLSIALVLLVMRGKLTAAGRNWSGIVLLGLLVADLGRANLPWVIYWDYQYKYATNPVIDFLKQEPYKHRVLKLPLRTPPELALLDQLYGIEWAQHHFYYYNIQSLDIVQMSREPVVFREFEGALNFDGTPNTMSRFTRRWELTNTRYSIGPAVFLDVLNTQLDPVKQRFKYALRFNLEPKPGVNNPSQLEDFTAVLDTNGNCAVFEFSGALPRVKLYSNWEVSTNDQATLAKLPDPAFDPKETVLVAENISPVSAANQAAGTVDFESYFPSRIVLKADAKVPCVLLLNDRHDPSWKVSVDGQPAELLRCNYIMRGVQLTPGQHTVEFTFRPPLRGFYVSASVMVLGLLLAGYLAVSVRRRSEA